MVPGFDSRPYPECTEPDFVGYYGMQYVCSSLLTYGEYFFDPLSVNQALLDWIADMENCYDIVLSMEDYSLAPDTCLVKRVFIV
jgi:hypothetical protein